MRKSNRGSTRQALYKERRFVSGRDCFVALRAPRNDTQGVRAPRNDIGWDYALTERMTGVKRICGRFLDFVQIVTGQSTVHS
ncbi:MAG: hypothetical protein LBL66_03940 [Clostridiales bacterium]|nr:hypothetical protein [Clostridiales bacterium]